MTELTVFGWKYDVVLFEWYGLCDAMQINATQYTTIGMMFTCVIKEIVVNNLFVHLFLAIKSYQCYIKTASHITLISEEEEEEKRLTHSHVHFGLS